MEAEETEPTVEQQSAKPWQFKPGKSGNPAGRPKGSRNRLGEGFVQALQEDFEEFGKRAIVEVRTERPHEYLKVIASLLPKQIEIKESPFDGVSDEQLAALLVAAQAALGYCDGSEAGNSATETAQPIN